MCNCRKFSIAGPGSDLAEQYSEVERLLSSAGQSMSKLCYKALFILMRNYEFYPVNREEAKTFEGILDAIEANRMPYANRTSTAYNEEPKQNYKAPEFDNAAFEPMLIE